MNKLEKHSRYMTKLLRHSPDDLNMDKDGFVKVSDLLVKLDITKLELDWIVENNNKKRFAFNLDESLIRASQGHNANLKVDVKMVEAGFLPILYHGTARSNIDSIKKNGLLPGNRKHVHLTNSLETAKKVALRHSKDIIILEINTSLMRADNLKIYISDNGVYLTEYVDPIYINLQK